MTPSNENELQMKYLIYLIKLIPCLILFILGIAFWAGIGATISIVIYFLIDGIVKLLSNIVNNKNFLIIWVSFGGLISLYFQKDDIRDFIKTNFFKIE
jgi:hypothetical protein